MLFCEVEPVHVRARPYLGLGAYGYSLWFDEFHSMSLAQVTNLKGKRTEKSDSGLKSTRFIPQNYLVLLLPLAPKNDPIDHHFL
jgi:hypothetical protein